MLSTLMRSIIFCSFFLLLFVPLACEEEEPMFSCCQCKCYALNIRGCDPVRTYTINSNQNDLDCADTCFERCNIQLLCGTHEANSCD